MDPLHATIEEFAAEGYTHVECRAIVFGFWGTGLCPPRYPLTKAFRKEFAMSKKAKRSKSKTLPLLGAAGLSLSLASGASAFPSAPTAPMQSPNPADDHAVTLGEEEISDVTLATFYVFDKEGDGTGQSDVQLVGHGCGGCHGCGGGGCHGCGGCGHGCGCHGCHGCHGCGGCVGIGIGCVGFGLGWWGGCGGCGGCANTGYWCWRHGHRIWCSY